MKRIFVLLAFYFSVIYSSSAQISKGSTLLGGNISYSTYETIYKTPAMWQGTDQKGFNFSPQFGKAINENLVIGAFARYRFVKSDQLTYYYDQKGYGGGLFVRKYKNLGKSNFYLFLDGSVFGDYEEGESNTGRYVSFKTMTYTLSAYPGISYAVSRRFHLEAGFDNLLNASYAHTYKVEDNTRSRTDAIQVGTSLDNISAWHFGFRVFLSSKRS